jgi:hypothetical protein
MAARLQCLIVAAQRAIAVSVLTLRASARAD